MWGLELVVARSERSTRELRVIFSGIHNQNCNPTLQEQKEIHPINPYVRCHVI